MKTPFQKELSKLRACQEAREWAGDKTIEQVWATCERGDWMLWLASRKNVDLRVLTSAKARCAKLVIHLMRDDRSVKAIEVAETFKLNNISIDKLNAAAYAAYAAVADAAYAAAAAAAYAAAAAADAYAADAYAATYAADAAACAVAYAADARKETLKKCADICREVIPVELVQ